MKSLLITASLIALTAVSSWACEGPECKPCAPVTQVNNEYREYINQNVTNVSPVQEADKDPHFKFFVGTGITLWENKRETIAVKGQGKVYPPQNGEDFEAEAGPVFEWNAWKTFTGKD